MSSGLSHPYQLSGSTFVFRGFRSNFSFLFHFFDENHVSKQNSPSWDAASFFVASHLRLFCLTLSHKKNSESELGYVLIRITRPCNVYAPTPHFYIVKLGCTGVYIFFLF